MSNDGHTVGANRRHKVKTAVSRILVRSALRHPAAVYGKTHEGNQASRPRAAEREQHRACMYTHDGSGPADDSRRREASSSAATEGSVDVVSVIQPLTTVPYESVIPLPDYQRTVERLCEKRGLQDARKVVRKARRFFGMWPPNWRGGQQRGNSGPEIGQAT